MVEGERIESTVNDKNAIISANIDRDTVYTLLECHFSRCRKAYPIAAVSAGGAGCDGLFGV